MKRHPQYTNLLLFDILDKEEGIVHFSTTRMGGVSNGPYSSFNMGNFSDDNPLNIFQNRNILARMFYMDISKFVIPHQTHGTKVLKIDEEFMNLDSASLIETLYGIDATITDIKGIFLCATTADCVPIIVYDKVSESVAAIHAGWKGTSGRITENTITEMQKQFGSNPGDMIACIGPSISAEHYEVGEEVVDLFSKKGFTISDPEVGFRNRSTSKYHLNLTEINRRELIRLGIKEDNIEVADMCTYSLENLFFSARRQTVHSGRMLTGIMMKER
ncbi:multi-copper polyphenol oxidoreductase laccase [Fermentimonas caenicola]|uniref:Purine nucleoside phosphorylase n=1 Tax=Fermentimonas caenicola TaxID=1562970 RepID=A0A098BXA2_9BACT|nr:multi-copper polyphenol oxidoreductase laccase [Fermentimonas caenicola]